MAKWEIVKEAASPKRTRKGEPTAVVRAQKKDGTGSRFLYFTLSAKDILLDVVGEDNFLVAISDKGDVAFIPSAKGKVKVAYYDKYAMTRCSAITDDLSIGDMYSLSKDKINDHTCVILRKI